MPSRKKSREQRLADRLLRGASKGAITDAKSIIQEGAQVTCYDENGATPLHLACSSGHLEMVQMLIENGAPVNVMNTNNYAPIHLAARKGHAHIIKVLDENGAVINIKTRFEKRTALHIGASVGSVAVTQMLLQLGAKVNQSDIYGSTPLHFASMAGQTDTVRILLLHKADVLLTDKDGWSALHFAAQNGHTDLLNVLLASNAQIDAQTKYGRTPLHCACNSANLSTVEALLSRGASIAIKDSHGKTVLQTCKDVKVLQIINIFAQDQRSESFQSADPIAWDLPVNKLMSMKSITMDTKPDEDIVSGQSPRFSVVSSVPDFHSVGEVTDGGEELNHIKQTSEEMELFKIPEMEPIRKVYRKMQLTVQTLLDVLDVRYDSMQKHVTASIRSRSIAASNENVKEIHGELQNLKQNVEDFRIEIPAELQTLVRCLHDFVGDSERSPTVNTSIDTTKTGQNVTRLGRKKATSTKKPVSLYTLSHLVAQGVPQLVPGNQEELKAETTRKSNAGADDLTENAVRRQSSLFEEDAAEVAQTMRLFHHVANIVGAKKGVWNKMHSYLHQHVPEAISQATAQGIEANYSCDNDRAFESMWAWYWQRSSASIDPLSVIIDSLEHVGIGTKQIDTIKALVAVDTDDKSSIASDDAYDVDLQSDDSDYLDGVRIQDVDSDYEEADQIRSEDVKEKDHKKDTLTHLQKIKAQRRISSTPLHDYKDPYRILHPETVRGVIPEQIMECDEVLLQDSDASSPEHPKTSAVDATMQSDGSSVENNSFHTAARSTSVSDASTMFQREMTIKSPLNSPKVRFSFEHQQGSDVHTDLTTNLDEEGSFSSQLLIENGNNEKEYESDVKRKENSMTTKENHNTTDIVETRETKQRKIALASQPFWNHSHPGRGNRVATDNILPTAYSIVHARSRTLSDSSTSDGEDSLPDLYRGQEIGAAAKWEESQA